MTKRGLFSANLLSLELQLKSLFDEVGGTSLISLLDVIAELSHDEQKIILDRFRNVTEKFAKEGIRITSCTNRQLAEMEESLYEDLVSRFESAKETQTKSKLSIVPARKNSINNDPIDLAKKRAEKDKSVIN